MRRAALLMTMILTVGLAIAACSKSKSHPAPPVPVLDSLSVSTGSAVQTVVKAFGSNFGATQGSSRLTVGSLTGGVTLWSDTEIDFYVETTVFPGLRDVVVRTPGGVSNALPFLVTLTPALYVNAASTAGGPHDVVFAFSVSSDGTLAALNGSPYATLDTAIAYAGDAQSIGVDAGNRRLYATGRGGVTEFAIDGVFGTLIQVDHLATGDSPNGIGFSPDGRDVYLAGCPGIDAIRASTTGVLSVLPGSPFSAPGCTDSVAISPDGTLLYSATEGTALAGFSVAVNGALTPLSGSPFVLGSSANATNARFDPAGTHLFVSDYGAGRIYSFDVAAGGALTPSAGSPVAAVPGADALAFSQGGTRLYSGSYSSGQILSFSVNGGTLTPEISGAPRVTTTGATGVIAVSSDDRFLFLLDNGRASIDVFGISSDGSLAPVQTVPLTLDATGIFRLSGMRVVP